MRQCVNADSTGGNYQRPVLEQPKPSLVPRRKCRARNRKLSQKGLRDRKIQNQNGIEGSGQKEPGNSANKHLFPPFSECSLSTFNVPVSMLENSVSAYKESNILFGWTLATWYMGELV